MSLACLTARTSGVKAISGSHGTSRRLLKGDADAAAADEEEGGVGSGRGDERGPRRGGRPMSPGCIPLVRAIMQDAHSNPSTLTGGAGAAQTQQPPESEPRESHSLHSQHLDRQACFTPYSLGLVVISQEHLTRPHS